MTRTPCTPMNPDKKAIEAITNPLPIPTECPYCKNAVVVVDNKEVYGKRFGRWPWVYRCVKCGARVGLHPRTNLPLGYLADDKTREARKRCKPAFEALWEGPNAMMTRDEAYAWLASALDIQPSECHFAMFDAKRCIRAQQLSLAKRNPQ